MPVTRETFCPKLAISHNAQKAPPPVRTHQRGQEQTRNGRASTEDIITFPPADRKSKEVFFMGFKIKLPDGTSFEFRREPMAKERFVCICKLVAAFLLGSGALKILALAIAA